jgi:hypothetical protein
MPDQDEALGRATPLDRVAALRSAGLQAVIVLRTVAQRIKGQDPELETLVTEAEEALARAVQETHGFGP